MNPMSQVDMDVSVALKVCNHGLWLLQTLHRMFIVNAGIGFRSFLWPAAQKLLDPMTIAKIQVMTIALVLLLSIYPRFCY